MLLSVFAIKKLLEEKQALKIKISSGNVTMNETIERMKFRDSFL